MTISPEAASMRDASARGEPRTLAALREQFDEVEELAERAACHRRQQGERGTGATPPERAAHSVRSMRPKIRLATLAREIGLGMRRGASDFHWLEDERLVLDALSDLDDAWSAVSRAAAAGDIDDPVDHARTAAAAVLRQRALDAPEFSVRLATPLHDAPIGPVSLLRALMATVAARLEPGGAGTRFPELQMALSGYRPSTTREIDPVTSTMARRELLVVRDELERSVPSGFLWDPYAREGDAPWDPVTLAGPGGLADAFVACDGARLVDELDAALSASSTFTHPLRFLPGPSRQTEPPIRPAAESLP